MDNGPNLPHRYRWLLSEPGPRLLTVALSLYGTAEKPGPGNNPSIMAWARQVGLARAYRNDATAWCGLFMAYVALQAGWDAAPLGNALWARNWASWGKAARTPMLGDVLVFTRGKGGHVGIYVGEDAEAFHVIGGNQADQVNIKRIAKSRLIEARRCPWRVNQPGNVRRVQLASTGALSENEA
jgi:uncharacterized protein (TIGR02594 family)